MGRSRKMSNDKSSGLSEDNIPPIQDMVQQNEDTHSGMLSSSFEKKVRPFLDLIDDLRAVGVDQDVALPTVAVIGDQSSGKSSVLESLSGVQLPRGTGIVTRCPLALKLKRGGSKWKCTMKYNTAEGHFKEDITAPSDVGDAVREAQRMLAGFQKGISKELITLEVESSSTPDLTLIDLPGIARVAVEGQPPDIEKKIKELILSYIEQKETIILVAIPCNVDIATTEALSMAQQCDPNGERTVGVLTKPDLMDPGTEIGAIKVLNNESIVLKKGYIMVKCRSQRDIDRNITLEEAIEAEKSFFETHSVFKNVGDKSTTRVLAKKLTNELVGQIKLITEYTKVVHGSAMGEYRCDFPEAMKMYSMARDYFAKWLNLVRVREMQWNQNLQGTVRNFMTQNTGRELPGFISFHMFENLARQHITTLEKPALDILREVADMVQSVAESLADPTFGFLPEFTQHIKVAVDELKQQKYEDAKTFIQNLFKMESQIYTQDIIYKTCIEENEKEPQFGFKNVQTAVASSFLVLPSLPNVPTHEINAAQSNKDIQVMKTHVRAYVKIAHNRLSDLVPMIIRYYLLQEFSSQLHRVLSVVVQEKSLEELMQEDSTCAASRRYLQGRAKRLEDARRIMHGVVSNIPSV
uniref:interferon-induced GTP-binding protein Mx3-like isoform X2 n=1 Tax=Myxine glutinosa TaxID=7769 RepID=UPI00358F13C4